MRPGDRAVDAAPAFRRRRRVSLVAGRLRSYALTEVSYTDLPCGQEPQRPDNELARMPRVTQMVPRDAPDRLVRLAMDFCGRCDMDEQFSLGVDLMIRGLEAECPYQPR